MQRMFNMVSETKDAVKNSESWGDLEAFKRVGARLGKPLVTISPRLAFIFNSSFLSEARDALKNKTHVVLYFSRSNNAIVLEFTDKKDADGAIKLSIRGNMSIAAKSFCNYYKLSADEINGRYQPELRHLPHKGYAWVIFLNKKR